jgi:twitching motility protein PilT
MSPLQIGKSITVDEYLKPLITDGVSDIHLKVNRPPLLRIHGILSAHNSPELTEEDTEQFAKHLLTDKMWEQFKVENEVDTSYSIAGCSRLRLNIFRQRGAISIAIRILSFEIPTIDELKVPEIVKALSLSVRGLIVVTGVTGSGKSSTLAAMIDHINRNRECNIISIEDPIEFLHRDIKSAVNQREIGIDTDNFVKAFRSAMRQDPDVILVGELRDSETMEIALRAAETGHLVLSTLHTTDAKETIGRFIDTFSFHQQQQIRIQLAANLKAVISQRLLEKSSKDGRILATEVMVNTATIKELIMDPEKSGEILSHIEKGENHGMHSFDQSILKWYLEGVITEEEGIKYATSPNDFKVKLRISY